MTVRQSGPNWNWNVLKALAISGLLLTSVSALASGWSPTPERKTELYNLVIQDCGSCHGLTMKGGLGSPLLPENLDGKDTEALVEIVLDGVSGTPMPPWRTQLGRGEAEWIIEQLKNGLPQ
jgi:cytochrome c55X